MWGVVEAIDQRKMDEIMYLQSLGFLKEKKIEIKNKGKIE